MAASYSHLFIIFIISLCNGSVNITVKSENITYTQLPVTITPSTTHSFFIEMSTMTAKSNYYDFESMNVFGINIDFCYEASLISEACALFQIIECLIFYAYRNEDGIQSRRPIFTFSFCVISIIYFLFIIPGICSNYTIDIELVPFFTLYLLRCICIFLWFWILICKYLFLYFDYNYVILLRLQAIDIERNTNHDITNALNSISSTNAIKSDFGSPQKASICIAIYFCLCFLVLCLIAILEHFFADLHEIYIIRYYHLFNGYFGNVYVLEFLFLFMCCIPFITAIIFTFRIANFRESWKIKQEIWSIFIVSAVLFIIDTTITWCIFLDESTRFALKFMCEAFILFWTTLISTIFVIIYIIQKRNESTKLRRHKKQITGLYHKRRKSARKKTSKDGFVANISSDSLVLREEIEIPLGYILSNQLGYSAFVEHCTHELNIENLLFLAHVCYFKKKFLDRIKDRQMQENDAYNNNNNNNMEIDEEIAAAINTRTPLAVHVIPPLCEQINYNNNNKEEEQQLIQQQQETKKHSVEDSEPFIELESITTPSISRREAIAQLSPRPLLNKYVSQISNATIRTDIAVYDEHEDDASDSDIFAQYPDVIEWTADNSLAILTFRMCHNYERESRSLLKDDIDIKSVSDQEEEEEIIIIPSLYMLANNVYSMFIKENSEYEVNLPSKLRTSLHFFFHQNVRDLEIEKEEYRLFHIFDKSWAEIWQLLSLNSYRRFLNTAHYESIQPLLQMSLIDELPELYRLILTHVNDDRHITNIIESHDPQKRQKIVNGRNSTTFAAGRIRSLNIEEIHDLAPTALINIDVKPLPVDEQMHYFGRTINMVRVKKAKV